MATSLILHKRITTTVAKAKALRTYVEPLITRSKEDTTHSRRMVFSYLQSKEAVNELFREISTKIANRPGGYTRIIKMGNRIGDNAEICLIELVDYNELLLAASTSAKTETRKRSRRGSGKAKETSEAKAEKPVEVAKPAPAIEPEETEVPVAENIEEQTSESESADENSKKAE
jgi:large subunit ribosomal protein L17